ncbi:MAG: nucleotidyltransferase domain-containing protein [Aigarchaeota archaeon]|nr:nucleotidyltransferase domain-containing protein [Aigarchaeota archaeon]MCX8192360.1 nucleotidyltransferase domain-containing protein [Nitrososphaeria archaeon]MDW7986971.1 nucleotidyltransferase domain-containing protein [Nitrososphaerota archaeon]
MEVKVVYDEERWTLLRNLRDKALKLMDMLRWKGLEAIVYGSIARGDVRPKSDVDVFIQYPISSAILQVYLEESRFKIYRKVLVQATPSYVPKAYIYLDEEELTSISFPLAKMKKEELEFYKLAGQLDYTKLKEGIRVPGINKDLLLIIPVEDGHIESPVTMNIEASAKILGVDPRILRNRIKVLERRREHGRTGVYREIEVSREENFEDILSYLEARDPALRRRLRME